MSAAFLSQLRAADLQTGGAGVLTLPLRSGGTVSVSNRYDGRGYSVWITEYDRFGSTLWNVPHSDIAQENAVTAAADLNGAVYVAGFRFASGAKYLWTMKISPMGVIQWERVDAYPGCTAFNVAYNGAGDVWTAGSCVGDREKPMRLAHYDTDGNFLWAQNYDAGGRNYVRTLTLDLLDRATVGIEVYTGSYSSGSSSVKTAVFDKTGYRMVVY